MRKTHLCGSALTEHQSTGEKKMLRYNSHVISHKSHKSRDPCLPHSSSKSLLMSITLTLWWNWTLEGTEWCKTEVCTWCGVWFHPKTSSHYRLFPEIFPSYDVHRLRGNRFQVNFAHANFNQAIVFKTKLEFAFWMLFSGHMSDPLGILTFWMV